MLLWRISPFRNLNGEGGLLYSARWHTAGLPVVYLAESPAGALLEICANTTADDIPPQFTLLKVAGPDITAEKITLSELSSGWVTGFEATQRIGTGWLESRRSALLQVPSALVPETANFLFNPLHPDAALFQIERAYEYPFDLRLKG
jgi:RES domain-containing protein